jgi:hypothetical protein
MAQMFSPAADGWIRLFMLGVGGAVIASVAFPVAFARTDWVTSRGMHPPPQPVPFSHKHHAGELGIDCQYCHSSVADSARAGLPPTYTCMSCHSQIWTNAMMLAPVRESFASNKPLNWHRVAQVPEYVYFRHDIHIVKGVGCAECHGAVQTMPLTFRAKALTMEFCLDCHRDPAPHLRPRDQVTNMTWAVADQERAALGHELMQEYGIRAGQIDHCYVCHR